MMVKGISFGKENNKFTWGQTVQVKKEVPKYFHPSEIASICGITKIKFDTMAQKYNSNIGDWLYIIEFVGGTDIQIPECYLEEYEK